MSDSVKFCTDCKYSKAQGYSNILRCFHTVALSRNNDYYVTGEGEPLEPGDCSAMRIKSECGDDAKLFEPKEETAHERKLAIPDQRQD